MTWKRAMELRKAIAWSQAEGWKRWVRIFGADIPLRRAAQARYFFWYAKWVTGA